MLNVAARLATDDAVTESVTTANSGYAQGIATEHDSLGGLVSACHACSASIEKQMITKSYQSLRGIARYVRRTLEPYGWIASNEQQLPVDQYGQPLPWWTYPSIEFVAGIIRPGFRVFEYGGGHSTLWWEQNGAIVTAVEHDPEWTRNVASRLSGPGKIVSVVAGAPYTDLAGKIADAYFRSDPRTDFSFDDARMTRRGLNDSDFIAYADAINADNDAYDCVVIDGMARRLCAHFAVLRLKENGLVVFDNSSRSDYMEGYQYLVDAGFCQLRFWGSVPGASFPSCTSVFVRDFESLPKEAFRPSVFDIPEY